MFLPTFPHPLTSLHNPANCKLNYPDLLEACHNVSIEVADDMAQAVEKETRKYIAW